MDQNGDELISMDEFRGPQARMFENADSNRIVNVHNEAAAPTQSRNLSQQESLVRDLRARQARTDAAESAKQQKNAPQEEQDQVEDE